MVTDQDEADVIELIERDVSSTLGDGHSELVRHEASLLRILDDREHYVYMVVQHVQTYIHDCRIDITWPACPNHPNHPMWFVDGMWCADGKPVAKLGELGECLARRKP